ncbi:ankyrin repeat domain-containing protein [Streptomyces sp. NPDC048483]|uniref:ankyrin repeat domain-containing protein n=1 Tax=Streptomyces sp. NPDC048483 TaxID=3154927 RepID=UPI00342325CA
MELDDVLQALTEAESGRRRPELTHGHYIVVAFDPDAAYEEEDDEADEGEEEDEEEEACAGAEVGRASSLYDAFDVLSSAVEELYGDHRDHEVGGDEYEEWLDDLAGNDAQYAPLLRAIHSPKRRGLAYYLMGYDAPMDIVTTDLWRGAYLGDAAAQYPGARLVFLITAAPPHHEEAYAVLEHQPTGDPSDADRALMEACRHGDPAALSAALATGAHVNALDERGMTPLHIATAHRHVTAVTALLEAGADPALQAAYGNAPHFAGLDRNGRVGSHAEEIEDDGHWRIVRTLIDAGAPLDAADRTGATVLDAALATLPYPEGAIRHLVTHGARSNRLAGVSLNGLLNRLPYHEQRELKVRVNQVRFVLESGPDEAELAGALHALLGSTGYYEREVPGEILLELVDLLVRHGVPDTPGNYGRSALEEAENWVTHGHTHYRPVVDRLRSAASPSTT